MGIGRHGPTTHMVHVGRRVHAMATMGARGHGAWPTGHLGTNQLDWWATWNPLPWGWACPVVSAPFLFAGSNTREPQGLGHLGQRGWPRPIGRGGSTGRRGAMPTARAPQPHSGRALTEPGAASGGWDWQAWRRSYRTGRWPAQARSGVSRDAGSNPARRPYQRGPRGGLQDRSRER